MRPRLFLQNSGSAKLKITLPTSFYNTLLLNYFICFISFMWSVYWKHQNFKSNFAIIISQRYLTINIFYRFIEKSRYTVLSQILWQNQNHLRWKSTAIYFHMNCFYFSSYIYKMKFLIVIPTSRITKIKNNW